MIKDIIHMKTFLIFPIDFVFLTTFDTREKIETRGPGLNPVSLRCWVPKRGRVVERQTGELCPLVVFVGVPQLHR